VTSERCSIEEHRQNIVDGRVVSSGVTPWSGFVLEKLSDS
jgi:hypothetical protein